MKNNFVKIWPRLIFLIFILSLGALNCSSLGGTETGNPTSPTSAPSEEGDPGDDNTTGSGIEGSPSVSWSELHISQSDCMSDQDVIITSDGSLTFLSVPEEAAIIEQWSAELSETDLLELDDLITTADLTRQTETDIDNASACDPGPSFTLTMTGGSSYTFHVAEATDLSIEAPAVAALLEKIESLTETYAPTDGSQFIPVGT